VVSRVEGLIASSHLLVSLTLLLLPPEILLVHSGPGSV